MPYVSEHVCDCKSVTIVVTSIKVLNCKLVTLFMSTKTEMLSMIS